MRFSRQVANIATFVLAATAAYLIGWALLATWPPRAAIALGPGWLLIPLAVAAAAGGAWVLRRGRRPAETGWRTVEPDDIVCPHCWAKIEPDYRLCPECHATLRTPCPRCGRLLKAAWTRCPACAAEVAGEARVEAAVPEAGRGVADAARQTGGSVR